MLVITRKNGESIQIGEGVFVEVLEVRGGRVRLGISAPREVEIRRTEIVVPDDACVSRELKPSPAISRVGQLALTGS